MTTFICMSTAVSGISSQWVLLAQEKEWKREKKKTWTSTFSQKPFPKICPSLDRAVGNSFPNTMGFMEKEEKRGSHPRKNYHFLQYPKTKTAEYHLTEKERETEREHTDYKNSASFLAYKSFQDPTHPPRINHIKSNYVVRIKLNT